MWLEWRCLRSFCRSYCAYDGAQSEGCGTVTWFVMRRQVSRWGDPTSTSTGPGRQNAIKVVAGSSQGYLAGPPEIRLRARSSGARVPRIPMTQSSGPNSHYRIASVRSFASRQYIGRVPFCTLRSMLRRENPQTKSKPPRRLSGAGTRRAVRSWSTLVQTG